MSRDHLSHGLIGAIGTTIAALEPDKAAAVFAGVATGAWMLWQLGAAIYDRARKRPADENTAE